MIRHGKALRIEGVLHRRPLSPDNSKIELPFVSQFTMLPKQVKDAPLACRRNDPELWFETATVDVAKAFCTACPIQDLCLEEALNLEQGLALASRHGVWGGTTPEERHKMEGGSNVAA